VVGTDGSRDTGHENTVEGSLAQKVGDPPPLTNRQGAGRGLPSSARASPVKQCVQISEFRKVESWTPPGRDARVVGARRVGIPRAV
jgi:hypothetical protein